eukprot:GHVN01102612.1.p1 GENE.GHVN01102612.1~~GHVN01102612.1.p1  ORF type:complete len:106 (-),score=14.00 GHVN01102612.1:313-630(-)
MVRWAGDHSVVLGDLNFRGIDWEEERGSDAREARFVVTLQETGWHQVIRSPTHSHGGILDLLLVQRPEAITDDEVIRWDETRVGCDHSAVVADVESFRPRLRLGV